jgi:hypothetical protein
MPSVNGNHTIQWLAGVLVVVLVSMIAYVWVDRESRLAAIEERVSAREQAWHQARYLLQERIGKLEYDIKSLQEHVFALEQPKRPNPTEPH